MPTRLIARLIGTHRAAVHRAFSITRRANACRGVGGVGCPPFLRGVGDASSAEEAVVTGRLRSLTSGQASTSGPLTTTPQIPVAMRMSGPVVLRNLKDHPRRFRDRIGKALLGQTTKRGDFVDVYIAQAGGAKGTAKNAAYRLMALCEKMPGFRALKVTQVSSSLERGAIFAVRFERRLACLALFVGLGLYLFGSENKRQLA